ncbi:MAG: hypothetical protein Q7K16_00455 [Candidatus Azambacteria bacterium]|nr:hypothetical protein [Candidatus Azambacteria bacterium]
MKYPVWIRDGKSQMPNERIFYEIAKNGVFLHRETSFWKAVVPVRKIGLEVGEVAVSFSIPRIPKSIVCDIVGFFTWIYRKHYTEVVALLWISEDGKNYRVSIPDQVVSVGYVKYEIPDRRPGELLLGTFHSHCVMSAFHSHVDIEDEGSFDGIHGTFGNFSSYNNDFSISLEATIQGTRFKLDPMDRLEGIVRNGFIKINKSASYSDRFISSFLNDDRGEYALAPGFETLQADYKPPQEWVDKVKIKTWYSLGESRVVETKVNDKPGFLEKK